MKNISLNGETVVWDIPSKSFFILDILYCEQLKEYKNSFDEPTFVQEVKYGNIDNLYVDFAQYTIKDEYTTFTLNVANIEYSDSVDLDIINLKSFYTDTGVIACVDKKFIELFLELFNYDEFVDAISSPEKLTIYIDSINANLQNNFAIISTPGIGKGYDFEGSGTYIIKNSCIRDLNY